MNTEHDLKAQLVARGVKLTSGANVSLRVQPDESGDGFYHYDQGRAVIAALSSEQLQLARTHLELDTPDDAQVRRQLELRLELFDEVISAVETDDFQWLVDGEHFEDDVHRTAWVLAQLGVLQASGFLVSSV